MRKTVDNNDSLKIVEYLDGFQYAGNVLQFFPTAEGYVKATPTDRINSDYHFNYIYNYTDHLGNVRLSYAKDPQTGNLKILDESHYYPFGLKHQEYQASSFTTNPIQGVIIAPVANNPFKYKFGNKEYQDELNLNVYDFGARNYDPALGRWMNIDPLAEIYKKISTYSYSGNNPVIFIDIDGMRFGKWDQATVDIFKREIKSRIEHNNVVKEMLGDLDISSEAMEKITTALDEMNNELTASISELEDLEEDSQLYMLQVVGGDVGNTYYDSQKKAIIIGYTGSTGNFLHETKHAHQYFKGDLNFNMDKDKPGLLHDITDEHAAYKRQCAWERCSPPSIKIISGFADRNGNKLYSSIPQTSLSIKNSVGEVSTAWSNVYGKRLNLDLSGASRPVNDFNSTNGILYYLKETNEGKSNFKTH